MKETTNYKLKLPEGSDFVSPAPFNENFEVLDTKLKTVENEAGKVAGHKHAAGDISSGVFSDARVPYLVPMDRLAATVGPATYSEALAKDVDKTFSFPFSKTLTERPRLVRLFIASGAHDKLTTDHWIADNPDKTLVMELMYNGRTGHFDAYFSGYSYRTNTPEFVSSWFRGNVDAAVAGDYAGAIQASFTADNTMNGGAFAAAFGTGGSSVSHTLWVKGFQYSKSAVELTLITLKAGVTAHFSVVGQVFV